MEAKLLALIESAVDDADGGTDEDAVFGGLEHVDGFLVRRLAVIDHIYSATNGPLYSSRCARMAVDLLAEVARDIDRGLHLFLAHHGEASVRGGAQVVSGDIDLDVVDTLATAQADGLHNLLFAIGDHAEAFVIHVCFPFVAEAARDGDLRACGAHARPRQPAGIDFVADDDIEPQLGGGSAVGAGESVIEQRLCIAHGEQEMLFRRNVAEIGVVYRPTEGDVGVAFHQARHQRSAAGLDDRGAIGRKPARRTCDGFDSGAFDKHVARKGRRAAAVPYIGTTEENWLHRIYLFSSYNDRFY